MPARLTCAHIQAVLSQRTPATAGDEAKWLARVGQLHAAWAGAETSRDSDITPIMLAATLAPAAWLRGDGGGGSG